ncbi:MAG: TetR/AcrR family transcriptional regulator [Chloroflexota bacterium]
MVDSNSHYHRIGNLTPSFGDSGGANVENADFVAADLGSNGLIPSEPTNARERVLQAAEQLFMERGYAAITLRDIADALEIRQASLYYHFPDGKEQLFVAVAEAFFARHQNGIVSAIAQAEDNVEAELRAVSAWFAQQPSFNLLAMMHTDMPALSQENRERLYGIVSHSIFIPIRSIFENGMSRNEISPIHADLVTGAFLSIMDGIGYRVSQIQNNLTQHNHHFLSSEVMATEMIRILLDGLRPRSTY